MKKTLSGIIVSNKMSKTVVVKVERKFSHPLYKKVIIRHKKYKVHSPEMKLEIGDQVLIEETKPIAKDKHFKVLKKLNNVLKN